MTQVMYSNAKVDSNNAMMTHRYDVPHSLIATLLKATVTVGTRSRDSGFVMDEQSRDSRPPQDTETESHKEAIRLNGDHGHFTPCFVQS